jgi:hypothetical protein
MLLATCFGSAVARAQSGDPAKNVSSPKSSDSAHPELQDVKPEPSDANKLTLKDAGPLSPEEAARRTAKGLANQKNHGSNKETGKKADPLAGGPSGESKPAPEDAVVEFQPAVGGSGTSSSPASAIQDKQTKSTSRRVHGDLYGAKGGTGHADGGSVGATSKGGKTSIYVESDQARGAAPQPR